MYKIVYVFVFYTVYARPQINLEYQPVRPFHHPKPGNNLGQIIQPGRPWPSNPQGYQNFSQTTPGIEDRLGGVGTTTKPSTVFSLEYKPNRPLTHPKPGSSLGQVIPPGQAWPDTSEGYQNFSQLQPTGLNSTSNIINLENKIKDTSSTTKKPSTNLEYQPNRPPFHPQPGSTLGQIVPPGEPWPDSPEGYQNFSQSQPTVNLENKIKDTVTTTTRKPGISLEYQPNRPPFHPQPGSTLGQVVPPGEPWPDSPEGYQNFSQLQPTIHLENKIKDTVTTTRKPGISLEYQPNRPPFHPKPGSTLGQVVPPCEPWPDSPGGYQNFSQMPNLENRVQSGASKIETTTKLMGFLWERDDSLGSRSEITEGPLYTSAVVSEEPREVSTIVKGI